MLDSWIWVTCFLEQYAHYWRLLLWTLSGEFPFDLSLDKSLCWFCQLNFTWNLSYVIQNLQEYWEVCVGSSESSTFWKIQRGFGSFWRVRATYNVRAFLCDNDKKHTWTIIFSWVSRSNYRMYPFPIFSYLNYQHLCI